MVALSALTSKIEIDVHGTVFGGTAVWTDITQYVMTSPQEDGSQELQIQWGRQSWLGDVTQGQFGLVLRNSDGRFTPGRSGSPYYPRFTFGARVRISETVSGTTVRVADGYVTDITAAPRAGVYGTVTVNCADVLARMGNMPLRSLLVEELTLDGPGLLYELQEPDGSTTFADYTGTYAPAYVANSKYGAGVVTSAVAAGDGFIAGTMVQLANSDYTTIGSTPGQPGSWITAPLPALTGGPWTIELWVQPTGKPGDFAALFTAVGNGGGSIQILLENPATAGSGITLLTEVADQAGTTAAVTCSAGIYDGLPHHVAVKLGSDSKTLTLYVDGVSQGSSVAPSALGAITNRSAHLGMFYVGIATSTQPVQTRYPYSGLLSYYIYSPVALSTARVLAHYNVGANGLTGESTDARITRLLTYRANTGTSLDAGLGAVGQQDTDTVSLASALLDAGSGEGGVLYADGQGRITLLNRGHNFNPATTVTLDASAGEVDLPSTYVDDTQNVTNDVTVSRPGGADQRAYNQTSVTQLGDLATSTTVNVNTDAQTLDIANWTLAQGIRDQTSIPTLTVNLLSLTTTAQALAVLQLKPLDAVTVTNLPGFPPATTMTVQVQGGTYTRSTETASVELFCAPTPTPVLTTDGLVNGVSVAADTTDSATYVAAY